MNKVVTILLALSWLLPVEDSIASLQAEWGTTPDKKNILFINIEDPNSLDHMDKRLLKAINQADIIMIDRPFSNNLSDFQKNLYQTIKAFLSFYHLQLSNYHQEHMIQDTPYMVSIPANFVSSEKEKLFTQKEYDWTGVIEKLTQSGFQKKICLPVPSREQSTTCATVHLNDVFTQIKTVFENFFHVPLSHINPKFISLILKEMPFLSTTDNDPNINQILKGTSKPLYTLDGIQYSSLLTYQTPEALKAEIFPYKSTVLEDFYLGVAIAFYGLSPHSASTEKEQKNKDKWVDYFFQFIKKNKDTKIVVLRMLTPHRTKNEVLVKKSHLTFTPFDTIPLWPKIIPPHQWSPDTHHHIPLKGADINRLPLNIPHIPPPLPPSSPPPIIQQPMTGLGSPFARAHPDHFHSGVHKK